MRLKDCFINNYWVTLLVREPCFYIQLNPSEIVHVGLLRFYLQNFSNTFYTFLIFTVRLSHDLLKTFLLEKFEKLIHRKFKPHFYWMLKQTRSSWYCCVGWTFKDIEMYLSKETGLSIKCFRSSWYRRMVFKNHHDWQPWFCLIFVLWFSFKSSRFNVIMYFKSLNYFVNGKYL